MGNNLYERSYRYYTAAIHNRKYTNLFKLGTLMCLPVSDESLTCNNICHRNYTDVTEHIMMQCTGLNDCRNSMWEEIVNVLNVETSVELWNMSDEKILDILLGAKWTPLRNQLIRDEFLTIIGKHANTLCTKL